ncbi:hypothetical protein QQ045_013831 [Rhodiola kirilowii]
MAPAAVEGLEGWSDPFGVGWCSGGAAALPDRAGSGCWRRWAVLSGGEAPVGEQGSMWTLVGLAGTLEQGGGLASVSVVAVAGSSSGGRLLRCRGRFWRSPAVLGLFR